MNQKYLNKLTPIGWREWASFPDWGIDYIKVKIDSGAKTSSIHVDDLVYFEKENTSWVRFKVSPWQKSNEDQMTVESPVHSQREIRSSSGYLEKRPVVVVLLKVAGKVLEVELSLTNRSKMGFRMLLGREALNGNFQIITGKSYLSGKPPKEIRQMNNRRKWKKERK
ncbi:hypothetical protein EXM22_16030 [Oceanispirochaeta crateris]|uniref:Retropepsin-like aspartic endopeptidase domain-containing protein n=1 Tax=Oceanispirochaeta crateris TaxID=2518645 RepID=A0A5C1QTQ7_9SPIO|nr:RimK/LysX family protein [Oceanispirochaeta crateris]QEN09412.1 hypothetical protein EXM22_16030 [Oceanispirochaeta crateris]